MNEALIGKGLKYPLANTPQGGTESSNLLDRINQSIFIILDTPVGSRWMLPDFGSHIQSLRFEPLDQVLIDQIDYHVRNDLAKWERRINITSIDFQDSAQLRDQSILFVRIYYTVINSRVEGNYVYPYHYGPRPITEVSASYGI